jgi:hypothetical protein
MARFSQCYLTRPRVPQNDRPSAHAVCSGNDVVCRVETVIIPQAGVGKADVGARVMSPHAAAVGLRPDGDGVLDIDGLPRCASVCDPAVRAHLPGLSAHRVEVADQCQVAGRGCCFHRRGSAAPAKQERPQPRSRSGEQPMTMRRNGQEECLSFLGVVCLVISRVNGWAAFGSFRDVWFRGSRR